MKFETFIASEEIYGEWSGKYEVRMLNGAESLAIEEVIFKQLQKKGGKVTAENYPMVLERTLSLVTCITRNGKSITNKNIDTMPKRLHTILLGLYQRLNVPNQEETDFLSKA